MRADKRSVGAIFDNSLRLIAPLFQRPYVWERDANWTPLWEAMVEVASRRLEGIDGRHRPHFLGAIVLDQLPTPTGTIGARQIIDGQQRMTTLQLAIAAFQDVAAARGLDRFAAAWKKLCLNDIPLSDDDDEEFKVWPTNVDREHFRRAMKAGSPERLAVHYDGQELNSDGEHRIIAAYLYFHAAAERWLDASSGDPTAAMLALYTTVKDDLHLVAIDLDPEDDAQLIFETLNALGAPLLPADLVKNYLFHQAPEREVPQLYRQYWQAIDENSSFWREKVVQGRLTRPRIDLFLQHYLTLVTRAEAGATHLFGVFRDYVKDHPELSYVDHLQQIRTYSTIYQRFQTYRRHTREEEFFYRLEQMDTTTVLPLLLEVFRRLDMPDQRADRDQILTDLESFLVRRAVCALTPKAYNRVFLDLLQEVTEDQDNPAGVIRQFFLRGTAETNRWPDDGEFIAAFTSVPLYTRIVRKRLRIVLEALNDAMHSDLSESRVSSRGLQIEHLIPKRWQDHWPLPNTENEEVEAEQRDRHVHLIGNLTLLNERLNPTISNGSWATKRLALRRYAVLPMNRSLDVECWDEDAIRQRSEALSQLALRLWPRPRCDQASS